MDVLSNPLPPVKKTVAAYIVYAHKLFVISE